MSKRVGLLAGLLVVVLGSGAVAQSSSPEATPLYAPDDLTLVLPSVVGDYDVVAVEAQVGYGVFGEEALLDLLVPFGKDLSDVRAARGLGFPAGDEAALDREGPTFTVWAQRVDGVEAASLVESSVEAVLALLPDEIGRLLHSEWRNIAGRQVYALIPTPEGRTRFTSGNAEFGTFGYANGEVLFVVLVPASHAAGSPPVADILAALP